MQASAARFRHSLSSSLPRASMAWMILMRSTTACRPRRRSQSTVSTRSSSRPSSSKPGWSSCTARRR
eukprot:447924-Heterocapsa_arctica.AAC.1